MDAKRIKIVVPIAAVMLAAVGLLALSSAVSKGATTGTLSDSAMSGILGKCGCYHKQVGDCGGSGSACVQCGGSCAAYTLAGSQAQACDWRAPENDLDCSVVTDGSGNPVKTVCKTNYTCSSDKTGGFKCSAEKYCIEAAFHSCMKCTAEVLSKDEQINYYCHRP
jgi:hypothetical protein